ncbi:perlucin-like protein [Mytilus californianus]|uniref:perlucin-like protein n=1 Tax=Mytilus californianus TaxID=6549 RepID=UPI0022470246|nr:perlucin-like protein [Mytilus californianus]
MQLICLSVAVAFIVMHFNAYIERSARLEGQIQQLTVNPSNLERQFHLLLGCGYGWQRFMSSCYDFQLRLRKTWYDAKIDCHTKGGYLVKIDNAVENWFLKSYIQTDNNTHNVWIGAHDSERESNFVWESDNSSLSYTDWNSGEPNNELNEDCASMRKKRNYRWNDVSCSLLFSYICEIQ